MISNKLIEQIANGELKELTIENEPLSSEDVKSLALALSNPACCLTELHLRNTQLTHETIEPLYGSLKLNTGIKVLDLSNNRIGGQETEALGELLNVNITIKSLRLHNCGLTDLFILNQRKGFNNRSFELLDLSNNNLQYYGIKYLAGIKHINKLNLSKNKIDAQDSNLVLPLQDLLCSNIVDDLDISSNNLSSILTRVLENNPITLKSLNLKCTFLTLEAAVELTNLLKESKTITAIDLGRNIWSGEFAHFTRLGDNLAQNNTLRSIGLEDMDIEDESLNVLISIPEKNPHITSFSIDCDERLKEQILVTLERNKKYVSVSSSSIFSPLSSENVGEVSVEKQVGTIKANIGG